MSKFSPDIIIPQITVDRDAAIPLYKQIYITIQSLILTGQLRSDDRLPSLRTLASDLQVSRNITSLAYEQLASEGYIYSVTGKGSFVTPGIDEITAQPSVNKQRADEVQAPLKSESLFDYPLTPAFIQGEIIRTEVMPFSNPVPATDHFPYALWVKSAHHVLRLFESLHLGYDDPAGYAPLRVALADYLRVNRALHCDPDNIIITTGAQQGLNLVAQLLVTRNDSFWMEDPGYGNAKAAFIQQGAKPCYIPLTSGGMDINWATKHYPKASLAYVTPSHQFPLGGTMPVSDRLQLLEWAGAHNMWIVEDDYDSEFRYSSKPIPSLQGLDQYNRVIYLGTFSKVIFPALRIGYIVLPTKELTQAFIKGKAFADRQNAITDQAILHRFITEGYFLTHLRKMRTLYKSRQDYLVDILNAYGKDVLFTQAQSSGMHILVYFYQEVNDAELADFLSSRNIITIPVSLYTCKFPTTPALILGYTAFNEKKLKQGALKFINAVKDYILGGVKTN